MKPHAASSWLKISDGDFQKERGCEDAVLYPPPGGAGGQVLLSVSAGFLESEGLAASIYIASLGSCRKRLEISSSSSNSMCRLAIWNSDL